MSLKPRQNKNVFRLQKLNDLSPEDPHYRKYWQSFRQKVNYTIKICIYIKEWRAPEMQL